MESSRRDLSNDMAEHTPILKKQGLCFFSILAFFYIFFLEFAGYLDWTLSRDARNIRNVS